MCADVKPPRLMTSMTRASRFAQVSKPAPEKKQPFDLRD